MHKTIAPVVFLSFLLVPLNPAPPAEKGLVGKGELLVGSRRCGSHIPIRRKRT